MTTTESNESERLRGAEYVLGVLDAEQRLEVERQLLEDAGLAATVAAWEARLAPLAEEIAAVEPPGYVWPRILAELGHEDRIPTAAPTRAAGFWDNLRLWHWIGIGASAVAVASLVVLFTRPRPAPAPGTAPRVASTILAATIERNDGVAGWTATLDVTHHRLVLVPTAPQKIAANRSTQLWLIPPGHKPISLGVFASDKAVSLPLSPTLTHQLNAKALLAVSVEPLGGSPTGQPTGPVIAKGSITRT